MSLPAIILKVLNLLNKEGIKAEVTPMYGSCTTRYIITLPGVQIDQSQRCPDPKSETVQVKKH